jgi:hypothetical protein
MIEMSMIETFFTDPPFCPFSAEASKQWVQEIAFDHQNKATNFWSRVINLYKEYYCAKCTEFNIITIETLEKTINGLDRFIRDEFKWVRNITENFSMHNKLLIIIDEASALLGESSSNKSRYYFI